MSSFLIYALGLVIILAGLIYGATLLHLPQSWIIVGTLIVLGAGIALGVGKTRQKDVPEQKPAQE